MGSFRDKIRLGGYTGYLVLEVVPARVEPDLEVLKVAASEKIGFWQTPGSFTQERPVARQSREACEHGTRSQAGNALRGGNPMLVFQQAKWVASPLRRSDRHRSMSRAAMARVHFCNDS